MSDTFIADLFPKDLTPPPTPAPASPETVEEAINPPIEDSFLARPVFNDIPPAKSSAGLGGLLLRKRRLREEERQRDLRSMSHRWPSAKTVVVANVKGQAGKTPTSILIASSFGHYSGTTPVLLDADPMGKLFTRLELPPTRSLDNMVAAAGTLADPKTPTSAVREFTGYQPDGRFDAVAGKKEHTRQAPDGTTELDEPTISQEQFYNIWSPLARVYPVIVVDTGNNLDHVSRAALRLADVLVVPVWWHKDYCEGAYALLTVMNKVGGDLRRLARTAIIVASARPDDDIDPDQVEEYKSIFTDSSLTIIDIPADKHIAQHQAIIYSQLAPATREASLRLSAEIARRFGA